MVNLSEKSLPKPIPQQLFNIGVIKVKLNYPGTSHYLDNNYNMEKN